MSQPAALASSDPSQALNKTLETENERLDRLTQMDALLLGGLYWPVEDVRQVLSPRDGHTIRILDIGSASGRWALEMATEFTHAEVLGIDKELSIPLSNTPPNCRFEALDLVDGDISHLEGSFDLVRCARPARWVSSYEPFIKKIVKMIKPGGLFMYSEGDPRFYDENKRVLRPAQGGDEPGTSSWLVRASNELKARAPFPVGMPEEDASSKVEGLLKEGANMQGIKSRAIFAPIGWPGKVEDGLANGEELGEMMKQAILEGAKFVQPVLLAVGAPAEEADHWVREALLEVEEVRVKSYGVVYHITARKAE